jgi:membrane-associated protease RseP (regulator of RpoE activity)
MRFRKILVFPGDNRYQFEEEPSPRRPESKLTHLVLFLLTVLTTTSVGAIMNGNNPFGSLAGFASGFPFSVTIMGILGVHELAHYFAGRKWGIEVTLPYFLPAPFPPIGTFGAVIRMKSSIPNRKALVDVGVAGPLAGFVLAVAASIYGLSQSEVISLGGTENISITLGESLLFKVLSFFVIGPLPAGRDVMLNPIAFAGWIGLFVTALNLMPFGQLDGGHVLFALSPRLHDLFRRIRIPLLILLGLTLWDGWYVWAVLLFFLGGPHPYPDFMEQRLGKQRTALAFAAIIVFILCLMPSPVKVG